MESRKNWQKFDCGAGGSYRYGDGVDGQEPRKPGRRKDGRNESRSRLVKEKKERNEKYDGCGMEAPAPSQSSRHDMTTATKVELEKLSCKDQQRAAGRADERRSVSQCQGVGPM